MAGHDDALRFAVLGPVEVHRGDRPVALGPRRHVEVLTLLLLRRGTPVAAEALADDLWHGSPPPTAGTTLQGYVAKLRQALEPGRPARAPAAVLRTRGSAYQLDVTDEAYDLAVFDRLCGEARRAGGPGEAEPLWRGALDLWRGPALADVAEEPWARAAAARLEEERLVATEEQLAAALDLGRHAEVVGPLRALVDEHPLRERLRGRLMLALYRCGRQSEALEVARAGRRLLGRELGVDPSPELAALEVAILRQEVAPVPVSVPVVVAGGHSPSRLPLAGRDGELALLRQAYGTALGGRTTVALVSGEPGIGKTRLVEEFTAGAAGAAGAGGAGGAVVVWGRCSDVDGAPPYWPWRQVLTRLGAEGIDAAGVPGAEDHGDVAARRFALGLAVADRLGTAAAVRPLVVVLEDVHWADPASVHVLDVVLSELRDAPLLIVVTLREGDTGPGHPVRRTAAALARHPSAVRVPLHGLDLAAVGVCIASAAGSAPSPAVVAAIAERSAGNPFFVTELTRLLDGSGEPPDGVPGGVRDVVRLRVGALAAPAPELLAAGAVVGRDFALATAADMVAVPPDEAAAALGTAVSAGLLVEPAPGRLRFPHALVRDALLEELLPTRAAGLHRAAVASLGRRLGDRLPAAVRAWHLLAARDDAAPAAALDAGREALRQSAVEAALDLAQRGLDVLAELDRSGAGAADGGALRRELRLVLGLARRRAGLVAASRAVLVAVAEDARTAGDAEHLARAALALAADGAVAGYWTMLAPPDPLVGRLLRLALEAAGGSAARPALEAALVVHDAVSGRPPRQDFLDVPDDPDTPGGDLGAVRDGRMRRLTARWAALWTPDRARERAAIAEDLLEAAAGDPSSELAARSLRMTALLELGDVTGSDAEFARLATAVEHRRDRDFGLLVAWWRSMRALLEGRLADAEEIADAVFAELPDAEGRGDAAADPAWTTVAAGAAAVSLQTIRGIATWERGRLGEVAGALDAVDNPHPGWQAVRALAHAEAGNASTAHRVLAEAFPGDLDGVPAGPAGVSPLVLMAEVLARAGDDGRSALVRERLAAYAPSVVVFAPGAVCMGAGTLYTGTLAALAGDDAAARADLTDAVRRNDALGAVPFATRARRRLAAVHRRAGERAPADALDAQAAAACARLGLALPPAEPPA